MAERAPVAAVAALACNALVWGLSWWPFRELQAQGLHPLWATALIYLFAVACLLLVRPQAAAVWARHPWLWLLAAAAGLTNVGFNWAVTVGDVVRVVLLFYLMPAWSVLLAWPLLGEKPGLPGLARLVIALAGVFIVLGEGGTVPWPADAADALALLGGFSFALTNILLRKFNETPAEARMFAMFGGGALLACAVGWLGAGRGVPGLPAPDVAWLGIGFALALAFLLGNLALQYGAARLAAHTTALVMLSEVVFASLSSVALGAATLAPRTLVGGALILAAAVWAAWPAPTAAPAGAQ